MVRSEANWDWLERDFNRSLNSFSLDRAVKVGLQSEHGIVAVSEESDK